MSEKANGNLALNHGRCKVITIQATEKQDTVKLRVAAYARVSSSSDDQMNSFAAQNQYYSNLIASKENWAMVDIYADRGVTGTSIEKRPDFRRLLSDCHRGLIDQILVKSISRFARNTTECLETIRELKSLGVSVFFEEQNIDTGKMSGEFLTALFAAMAQKESQTISENLRWGIQRRMKNGTYLPPAQPFGYRIIDKKIVIHEAEAEHVKEIFSMYLMGKNTHEIAEYLNDKKRDYPELNREWTSHKIQIILRNEKYIGNSLWQKTYTPEILPYKSCLNHNERDKYYVRDTHPRIIEDDTFRTVQALLDSRGNRQKLNGGNAENGFAKKLYCGCCGKSFRQKNDPLPSRYSCRTHESDKNKCPINPIPKQALEYAFLRLYYKLKHEGNLILEQMLHDLQTVRERQML